MIFDITTCVNYITANKSKKISEAFSRWVEKYGITRVQWILMFFLFSRGTLSQKEISQLMEKSDSSTMRLVDRLERDGLVKRQRSEDDRRIIYLSLTDEGSKLMKDIIYIGEDFNHVLLEGIDESDIETFMKVQEKMFANIMNDPKSQKK